MNNLTLYPPSLLRPSKLLYLILPVLLFAFTQCDDTPGTVDPTESAPRVQSVDIQPSEIQFRASQGIHDTTVTVNISADIDLPASADTLPRFRLTNVATDSLIKAGKLQPSSGNTFSSSFDLQLSTTDFYSYRLYVFAYDNRGEGNMGYQNLDIRGFSAKPPEILWVDNPDTVSKPSSGQKVVAFRAKVVHPIGQQNIDKVQLDFIKSDGSPLTGTPFQMKDDGMTTGDGASGDETARDSVYTRRFYIDNSNTNQTFDVHYWAIDKGGLSSDTVRTKFTITD